jgi:hypothetical protein
MRKLNTMEDFQRDICYRVLVREDESIELSASMRDRFHDVDLQVVVDGATLAIREAGVTFRKSPSVHCGAVAQRLEGLQGVVIGPGLSRALNAALGGAQGCGNLRTLLLGLLPLALNVKAGAGIDDEDEMLDTIHRHLQGTCGGYPLDLKDGAQSAG